MQRECYGPRGCVCKSLFSVVILPHGLWFMVHGHGVRAAGGDRASRQIFLASTSRQKVPRPDVEQDLGDSRQTSFTSDKIPRNTKNI